jgi:Tol biopolymer transport system component
MPSVSELLERESTTVDLEPGDFERLVRRRDRKRRNQRIGAGALAIILALVSFVALTRAFRTAERPADQPPAPKPPGIFSEVGGWIAYAKEGGKSGIYAVNPETPGDPKDQILLSPGTGWPVAWSSDGSKLLILRLNSERSVGRNFFGSNLFVLNADGTETRLTNGDDWIGGGSFSPDGSQVVYATSRGAKPPRIVVVGAAGGTPQVLLTGNHPYAPTFSPDGSKIAYFGGERLRVMSADGSGSRVLTHDVFGQEGFDRRLAWSPDGTRLAIDFGGNIYTIGADGSDLTQAIPHGRSPNWSPDGSRIAYNFSEGSGATYTYPPHLAIADADGKNTQEFGYARSGPWNPLVQPEPEVAQVPAASEGLTLTSTLLLVLALLALVAGAVLIRRRMVQRSRP